MKCDIIKDLLPLYIDGLTSEASNQEIKAHLAECVDCSSHYQEMISDIKDPLPVPNNKEVDFLKKIKRKNIKTVLIWIGITVTILLVLIKLFILGFPVRSDDMIMTHTFEDNYLKIEFSLINGHDLIMWDDSDMVYDENGNCIGFDSIKKPHWVYHNPFDDMGKSFSLGSDFGDSLNENRNYTNRNIIKFKDKDIVFINGLLTE